MDNIRLILNPKETEIKVKKSTFIGFLAPAYTQQEALDIIARVKKEHYNATHNCSAYIVEDGKIEHQNDDGEPSGTAGKPMLEVLRGNHLKNCVAVVTRYFGGILLGTGGLVRAYTQAVQEVIAAADIVTKETGVYCGLSLPYTYVGKIKHKVAELGVYLLEENYTSEVELKLLMSSEIKERFFKDITDLTSADFRLLFDKEVSYILVDNKVKIL